MNTTTTTTTTQPERKQPHQKQQQQQEKQLVPGAEVEPVEMLYETVWQASEPLVVQQEAAGAAPRSRRRALRFRSRRRRAGSVSASSAALPPFELLHSSCSSISEVHEASRVLAAVQSSGVLLGKAGKGEGGLSVLLRGGEASASAVAPAFVSSSPSSSSAASAVAAMLRVVSSEAPTTVSSSSSAAVNVLSLDPLAGARSVDAAAAALRPPPPQPPLSRSAAPPPPPLGAFGPAAASGNALFSARLLRRAGGEGGRVLPTSAVRLEPRPRGALAGLRAVELPRQSGGGSDGGAAAASAAASASTSFSAPLLPPPPGTVRLSVLAAGLNFRDVLNVLDMYPAGAGDPADVFGVVEEVGPPLLALPAGDGDGDGVGDDSDTADTDPLRPGDLVLGLAPGCLGPGALAPASLLVRFPRELLASESGGSTAGTMTAAEAATLPTAFATAILAFDAAAAASSSPSSSSSLLPVPCALPPGSRALIHAGAGGVGMAALRLASSAGVRCLATASSPDRRRLARERACGGGAVSAAAAGSSRRLVCRLRGPLALLLAFWVLYSSLRAPASDGALLAHLPRIRRGDPGLPRRERRKRRRRRRRR